MKTITVRIKAVYGNESIYPVCPLALGFAKLLGQKTLTRKDIKMIQEMGFKVEVVTDSVTL